ncbi:MAG: hypothetical protein DRP23_04230, partial [Thermotogae bacterium]
LSFIGDIPERELNMSHQDTKMCLLSEISIASKLKHVIQILIKFIQDCFQGDSVQTIYVGVHIFVTPAPIFETVPSST